MAKLESTFKNMLLSLTIITVVATAALAYVNELTKEPIAKANAKALSDAISLVVPRFDNDPTHDTTSIKMNGVSYIIYKAYNKKQFVGAAVQSSANGFGGPISILVGFNKEGNIVDYSILSHKETPGLGSKMATWFKTEKNNQNIKGLNPGNEPLSVKKDGGNVDGITASTISSRAFLKAVNKAYQAFAANYKDAEPKDNKENISEGNTEVDSSNSLETTTDKSGNKVKTKSGKTHQAGKNKPNAEYDGTSGASQQKKEKEPEPKPDATSGASEQVKEGGSDNQQSK